MVDVAVINTSEETAEVMELALQSEGWSTVRGYAVDFKRQRLDVVEFMRQHDPGVVVWDISIPYQENWRYFQEVRRRPALADRPIVLTTTNARVLRELVGENPALEIVDKPFSIEQLVNAVRAAFDRPG